jgi:hypothetical protein
MINVSLFSGRPYGFGAARPEVSLYQNCPASNGERRFYNTSPPRSQRRRHSLREARGALVEIETT